MTPDLPVIPEEWNEYPALEQVMALMNRCDPDHPHALQVGKLSCVLFDSLVLLHGLSRIGRSLLCYAALLHDIGWSVPAVPHHKASMNLILSDQTIPVSGHDRLIIALTARYHRKAHPSPGHPHFRTLPPDQVNLVRWSAAILRVADALDRSHDSRVRAVQCQVSERVLTIRYETTCGSMDEEDLFVIRKKAALLGEVSGREVEVRRA